MRSAWVWVNDTNSWLFIGRKRALVWENALTHKWHGIWRTEAGKILTINPRASAMEAMRCVPVRAAIPLQLNRERRAVAQLEAG